MATGEHEAALTAYNDFLQTEYARINHNIYKEALLEKADLLVKMGNKEEAYGQYGKVFSYIKTSFEKNYPKEIDRLCTRFQADQLATRTNATALYPCVSIWQASLCPYCF